MRNQESIKKEAIHRKKIQAKNRSTIYKYPIISNKNEQPYKKKKLSPTTNQNPHLYHDSLITKRKKNFKNCNKLPIKTETMQVHQTQEGNLSLLVPSRPVENDSLTAKTNKNQQQISTIVSNKNTSHARFYQIPEEEKFHLAGSSPRFSHYKKKQESRKAQTATTPKSFFAHGNHSRSSRSTTIPSPQKATRICREADRQPNQILQIVEKQKRKPLSVHRIREGKALPASRSSSGQGMARGRWKRRRWSWRGRRRRFLAALSEKSKIAGVPVSAAMSTANDVSTVRFGRWWWCWRRRRRSTSTCGPATMLYAKTIALLGVAAVLCALLATVDAAAKAKSDEPRPKGGHKEAEPVIEEVNAKQLERLLNEKDFVAVYWCKCFSIGIPQFSHLFWRVDNFGFSKTLGKSGSKNQNGDDDGCASCSSFLGLSPRCTIPYFFFFLTRRWKNRVL